MIVFFRFFLMLFVCAAHFGVGAKPQEHQGGKFYFESIYPNKGSVVTFDTIDILQGKKENFLKSLKLRVLEGVVALGGNGVAVSPRVISDKAYLALLSYKKGRDSVDVNSVIENIHYIYLHDLNERASLSDEGRKVLNRVRAWVSLLKITLKYLREFIDFSHAKWPNCIVKSHSKDCDKSNQFFMLDMYRLFIQDTTELFDLITKSTLFSETVYAVSKGRVSNYDFSNGVMPFDMTPLKSAMTSNSFRTFKDEGISPRYSFYVKMSSKQARQFLSNFPVASSIGFTYKTDLQAEKNAEQNLLLSFDQQNIRDVELFSLNK